MKRITISSDTVNGRGFRVATTGIRLDRYGGNPVLLWMHQRGTVIGQMRELRVEDGNLTGEPWFDEATQLSRQLKEQYEKGSVRACSMGIEVIDVQEVATKEGRVLVVTDSELFEVSLVDVPENPDSVVLRHRGGDIPPEQLTRLAKAGGKEGPDGTTKGTSHNPTTIKQEKMNINELAALLGLGEGANEKEVREAIKEMLLCKERLADANETIRRLNEEIGNAERQRQEAELAHVTRMVDKAVREQRITADKRERFINLGKKAGAGELEQLLDEFKAPRRIIDTLARGGDGGQWRKLSDVPAGEVARLRKEQPQEYARLYEAEYGIKPERKYSLE